MAETKAAIRKRECHEIYDNYNRRYVIQDRVPDAVWHYPIILPEKPKDIKSIPGYNKDKKDRKFPYYSDEFIEEMKARGAAMIKSGVTDEKYVDFIKEEWRRRREGFFFFNGDNLEWVTGHHYCMLQYWKIQATRLRNGVPRKGRYQPDLRDNQRDVFYAAHHARTNPKSVGLCYIARRRDGKSNAGLSIGYFDSTENEESQFAIQSKSLKDSQKQFKTLVDSWKHIPFWFKPEDTGETSKESKLVFGEKKRVVDDLMSREYQKTLNSVIYPANSKEEALDGVYLSFLFGDELGKSASNLDIYERWNITKECLMDGNTIIGFAYMTSTVEDQDKFGSESFKKLWDSSSPNKRLPNGQTDSGLDQLFLPAYYGYVGDDEGVSFIDEWGYSNIEAARKYLEKMYASKDGEDLLSLQRKYPLSITDCWVTTDGKNNFDTKKLIEQKIYNDGMDEWVRGNFMWSTGERWGGVAFHPNDNGRWYVAWHPEPHDRNKWDIVGTQKKPTRSFCYTGIDPFSHAKVVDEKQGSNGAAVTILKNYPGSPIKEGVVCIYDYRQGTPEAQVEDMIMQCVYYSSVALIESNVSEAVNGFRRNGYDGYAIVNPLEKNQKVIRENKKGYPTTSVENVENLISFVTTFISDNLGKREDGTMGFCPFNQLVQQLLDFNPVKRTPFDLVVALGLAVIAMRVTPKKKKTEWTGADWLGKINPRAIQKYIVEEEEAG